MRGLFITLEGIDGCGKSTQLELLGRALSERGIDAVVTREPGGTPLGERVRALLLDKSNTHIAPETELLLMVADRAQHVAELIRPAVEAGRVVISDRHADSSVVFQGYGRGLDLETVHSLNRFATGGLLPDLTLLFDLEPALARERLASRRPAREQEIAMTRFDDEEMAFHLRVREAYLKLAMQNSERIRLIEASGPPEATHETALNMVLDLIKQKKR